MSQKPKPGTPTGAAKTSLSLLLEEVKVEIGEHQDSQK